MNNWLTNLFKKSPPKSPPLKNYCRASLFCSASFKDEQERKEHEICPKQFIRMVAEAVKEPRRIHKKNMFAPKSKNTEKSMEKKANKLSPAEKEKLRQLIQVREEIEFNEMELSANYLKRKMVQFEIEIGEELLKENYEKQN